MKTFAGLAAFAVLFPAPTISHAMCHFNAERVVGCFPDYPENAAATYQRFKGDQEELKDPAVKEVLASHSCRVIVSSPDRPFHIFRRGHGEIATLSGYEPVSIVEFKTSEGGQMFSVDSRWISGVCDEAPVDH